MKHSNQFWEAIDMILGIIFFGFGLFLLVGIFSALLSNQKQPPETILWLEFGLLNCILLMHSATQIIKFRKTTHQPRANTTAETD